MCDENHLHVFQVLSYDLIWGRLSINRNNGGDIVAGTPIVQTRQKRPGPRGGRECLSCHAVMNFNHCWLVPDSNWQPTEMKRFLSHYSCLEGSVSWKTGFPGEREGMNGHSEVV